MAQKTEGYIDLEWTCPNCQSNNPGPQKTCRNCGSVQPADVTFHLPGEAKLQTDEAALKQAEVGPDVHCPYCGTRNSASAKACSQCGGDLTGAAQRVTGQVIGAFVAGPGPQLPCPSCGNLNPASALQCLKCGSPLGRPQIPAAPAAPARRPPLALWLGIGLVALAGCVILFLILGRTEATAGSVNQVSWNRTIAIEALRTVTKQDWKDEIPANSKIGACSKKFHNSQSQPAPVATEVCGTSYVVDQGTGKGKVVKDCNYQVYADYCEYTAQEWQKVDQAVLQGSDTNPRWPDVQLLADQRAGAKQEQYTVLFSTNKGILTFKTSDYATFAKCQIGTSWTLNVNNSNNVVSIAPPQ